MTTPDLVVRGGLLALPDGIVPGTLVVDGGRIAAVLPDGVAVPETREVLDADGAVVSAGVVDLHVHFDVPGIDLADDFRVGTASAAIGGVTFVVEHPFSDPPTTTTDRYAAKARTAAERAHVDFGLWGALTAPSLDHMRGQWELGASGFKAFLPDNDMGFPPATPEDLRAGMTTAAALGARVLVHAEDRAALADGASRMREAGRSDVGAFLDVRPPETEVRAVAHVLDVARATGAAVHLVHLSTPASVDLVAAAVTDGVAATCEVAAHHLLLTDEDLRAQGGIALCAPPLRSTAEVDAMWERVADGRIDAIVSDHCPCEPGVKQAAGDDALAGPYGIQGVQEYVALVLSEGLRRGVALDLLLDRLTARPAALCGVADRKGALRPGLDADLVVLRLDRPWTVDAAAQQYGELRWSPYDGFRPTVRVERTVVRGRTVAVDGALVAAPGTGSFVPLSRQEVARG
ncbi:allantoinase AllB [Nocardioides ginsengisoli]|uniref:Dihydroorotase family protein n=1 Tax=Nocardioides ginsengisoli TaxID=363868 RepID=A0ABW3W948_9ACTN